MEKNAVIIGAGPAGLACAYYLLKNSDIKPVILEESPYIGGISRTHEHNGNRMDLGGHRFFTKNDEVMKFWTEIFPSCGTPLIPENSDEKIFLTRERISRIYFLKKFFDYPISMKPQTFINMGFFNVIAAGFGYLYSCLIKRKETSLENFYINRFGEPLYKMFFEDYTEKVWGIHPSKISPDWGSQRVKGLSIFKVIMNCFSKKKEVETSLIEEFMYPPMGPGQFYEEAARLIEEKGGKIYKNTRADRINFENGKISSVHAIDNNGQEISYPADIVFSSMPVKDLVSAFNTDVPEKVKETALNLPYRDFMTAGLLVSKLETGRIKDCWIYIQERNVKLGRLQIFNNWSPYMVKNPEDKMFIGLEYFCQEGDSMWNMPDNDFIKMAAGELEKIGIIKQENVSDSAVIRVKKAYPAYFGAYKDFDIVKNYLNSIENLYCIGRNGQHRYNNMDHSILTGFEAAKAYLNGLDKDIVWKVNTENEYHETK